MDFTIKAWSSMLVCGPTKAGKSTSVHNLLKENFFKKYMLILWRKKSGKIRGQRLHIESGLPDNFLGIPLDSVVILVGFMNEAEDHAGVIALFTKLVHHRNLFAINITQNFFHNSRDNLRSQPPR